MAASASARTTAARHAACHAPRTTHSRWRARRDGRPGVANQTSGLSMALQNIKTMIEISKSDTHTSEESLTLIVIDAVEPSTHSHRTTEKNKQTFRCILVCA